jgi:hypothetical protein
MNQMKLFTRKPSPAMVVATLALFVALAGTGVAATGGNFILGQSNTAGAKTSLTAGFSDRALAITNMNTGSSATALGLNVAAGRPPLIVNSSTKVANLNADQLDGINSSAFIQGGGHVYHAHFEGIPDGGQGTLLDLPGSMYLTYSCGSNPQVSATFYTLDVVAEYAGTYGYLAAAPAMSATWGSTYNADLIHLLASRPTGTLPPVLEDVRIGEGWDYASQTCSFQVVGGKFA